MSSPTSSPKKNKKGGDAPWEEKHTDILKEGIVRLVLANKRELYLLPGIIGEVDGHGNSRTSAKVDSLLKDFAKGTGLDAGVIARVKDELKLSGKRASNGAESKPKRVKKES